MISPKIQAQPQAKSSKDNVVTMSHPVPSEQLIRERAYQLYESRGREPGQDEQDWLLAEQQILKSK
jgi:hypothetical protein